jgi:hypothetical protein
MGCLEDGCKTKSCRHPERSEGSGEGVQHAAKEDSALKEYCPISPPEYKNRDSLPLPMTTKVIIFQFISYFLRLQMLTTPNLWNLSNTLP